MATWYERQRLSPAQARTVSDRRYADAEVLRDTRQNVHANGAMYLGGIALELLLKALLLEKHPWLQSPFGDPAKRSQPERALYELLYVRHDLEELLSRLSDLEVRLAKAQAPRRRSAPLLESLKGLCSEWTIHIRYSTQQANVKDARLFLDAFKELRPWLR